MDCPNNNLEDLSRRVRKEKAQFVMRLSEAYAMSSSEVDDIRYFCFDDCEVVRIRYYDNVSDYINVTADSIDCLAKEIAVQINGGEAYGHIRDAANAEKWLIEKLAEKWRI